MPVTPGRLAVLIAGGAAAVALAVAPVAGADPVWPVGGGEPADATIAELADQGYDVQVNWVNGYPDVPLSQCWVNAIHNPDGPPTSQHPLATVYVDIGCPSENLD
ncbi:MAG: hypothetical protein JO152_02240 [Mycobacteriaceae bacterium]|nr:hypothetical protein [Mycobacteriaceae bacterium]